MVNRKKGQNMHLQKAEKFKGIVYKIKTCYILWTSRFPLSQGRGVKFKEGESERKR